MCGIVVELTSFRIKTNHTTMKKSVLFLVALLMMVGTGKTIISNNPNNLESDSTLTIYCSPKLNSIVTAWANEYLKTNPYLIIEVENPEADKLLNFVESGHTLGFVSAIQSESYNRDDFQKILVGRDVIVPIINKSNPFLKRVFKNGISNGKLANVLENGNDLNWGALIGDKEEYPIHYYTINDNDIKLSVSNFLGMDEISIESIEMINVDDLIEVVQSDPHALGFCRITDIIDLENNSIIDNIEIMPIDKNENGELDYFENIYQDLESFSRGVWIGKYPQSLVTNIYSVYSRNSENNNEKAFLTWVLNDGQKLLTAFDYLELLTYETKSNISKLNTEYAVIDNPDYSYSGYRIILYVLSAFILVVIISSVFYFMKSKKLTSKHGEMEYPIAFSDASVSLSEGLFYDKTHTWAFMKKDGIVKIGIDDWLPQVTGSITGIRMKNTGETIKKGEIILSLIQDGKQLNIKAPVSGTIKEQNHKLSRNASLINISPYTEGWIYAIQPSNWLREIQFLFSADNYRLWLRDEFTRLKDFMALALRENSMVNNNVVYQEGGDFYRGFLKAYGPKMWEDFQSQFIETTI